MKNMLLILLALGLLSACQSESPQDSTQDSAQQNKANHTISDSLKQQYQKYYNAIEKPFSTHCVAERNKVNPADAAPLDTAFFIFREQLKEIVAEKDIFKLLEHIDKDIKIGFGAENGLEYFVDMWALNSPEQVPNSELWPVLKEILDLGGLFNNKGDFFSAPYIDACYPTDVEPYETGVIIGSGVRMRAGPSLDTKVLANLSYDVLKFVEITPIEEKIGSETHPWVKVKTMDDVEGFVWGKFFRSPLDYRAGFQKNSMGNWKMVTLLAGD